MTMLRPLPFHTLEETARAMGLTVGAVRKTEIRALAKLRNDPEILRLAKESGILRGGKELCVAS